MSQDEHTPDNLEEHVIKLTEHYTQIVSTAQLMSRLIWCSTLPKGEQKISLAIYAGHMRF